MNFQVSQNTWIYDLKNRKWTSGPKIEENRQHHHCTIIEDVVFLMGGLVERVFPASKILFWKKDGTSRSGLTAPWSINAVIKYGKDIYILSGTNRVENQQAMVSIYQMTVNPLTKQPKFDEIIGIELRGFIHHPIAIVVPYGYLEDCKGE